MRSMTEGATAADILELETSALTAWPALETIAVDGWALRFAGGHTKRANSANALAPTGAFDAIRREAERLYASKGLAPIFRITPLAPDGCDAALAQGGYRHFDPSLVMITALSRVRGSEGVEIAAHPSSGWLEGFAAANSVSINHRLAHDAILNAIPFPAAFATLHIHEQPVAFGLAVRDGAMVWLFDIVVAPSERGRGHGRAITEALLAWGESGGAAQACLQVREANETALTLYRSLGFAEAYRYHYRVAQ